MEMFERAIAHEGFSVIECLSECVEFYPGAFDASIPRKGGEFTIIEEKTLDGTPEDELRHDPSCQTSAYQLANLDWPGVFGVFYETERPTKNALEAGFVDRSREENSGKSDSELLQASFARFK